MRRRRFLAIAAGSGLMTFPAVHLAGKILAPVAPAFLAGNQLGKTGIDRALIEYAIEWDGECLGRLFGLLRARL